MKLNLGCGLKHAEGYINIDFFEEITGGVDRNWDLNKPLDYAENSVEEIVALHSFEHLNRPGLEKVVDSWFKALYPGAKLVMELPNFAVIIGKYVDSGLNSEKMLEWIFGNQGHKGQFHHWGWTPHTLRNFLLERGFSKVGVMESLDNTHEKELCFRVEAIK